MSSSHKLDNRDHLITFFSMESGICSRKVL